MIPGNATLALEEVLSAWPRDPAQFETRAESISDFVDGFAADLADRDDDEAVAARLELDEVMLCGLRCGSAWARAVRMALEGFQQNTVDAAYRALCNGGGSRRFLIAHEVGLGKTISLKAVAQRLKCDQDDPLNVVYLCPNLDIASQNLTMLTSLDETWDTPPDRLSLATAMTGRETVEAFRLFSYTPDTSLPGWKAGQRAGRAEERWLIAGLFARIAPKFWRSLKRIDDHNVAQGHNRHFTWTTKPPKHLPPAFLAALIRVLQIPGIDLDAELRGWLKARGSVRGSYCWITNPKKVRAFGYLCRCNFVLSSSNVAKQGA